MVTPLARRLKPIRRALAESASRFELNQILRLCARARVPARIVVDPSGLRRPEEVVAIRHGRGKQGMEVVVAVSALPPAVRAAGAEAVEQYVRLRHAVCVASHPALEAEIETPAADTPFARQLRALATVDGVDREIAALAAGALRRGSKADLEATCSEYFGVSVRLEVKSATAVRLRVGPLTFAEYGEFHPHMDGSALAALLALAGVFHAAAATAEVLLILRADETPPCIPNTDGAMVGFTCWPHDGERTRHEDVEFLVRHDSLGKELQP